MPSLCLLFFLSFFFLLTSVEHCTIFVFKAEKGLPKNGECEGAKNKSETKDHLG